MSDSSASNAPIDVICMACSDRNCDFKPTRFQRRPVGDDDVLIEMQYCGICHTDVHAAAGHLGGIGMKHYPCVPGHELAGVCIAVGKNVTRVKVGDHVGVGCMVDSCLKCAACLRGEEQMCSKQVGTYNAPSTPRSATYPAGGKTIGGYTNKFVVHERFAIVIPPEYPLEFAGPVMCAGVTLYDPLHRYGATKGVKVGIVGLGGLGGMGIKIAKAMGCEVTAISRSANKEDFAKKIGADHFLVSSSAEAMTAAAKTLDLVLNTIPSEHDYDIYTALVAPGGKHIILGLNSGLIAGMIFNSFGSGSKIRGSGIGGITSHQAVIDLCAKNNIRPEIKLIKADEINGVYEVLNSNNDSGLRYVIDIAGSLNDETFKRYETSPPPPPPKIDPLDPNAELTVGRILSTFCCMFCCCKWW